MKKEAIFFVSVEIMKTQDLGISLRIYLPETESRQFK